LQKSGVSVTSGMDISNTAATGMLTRGCNAVSVALVIKHQTPKPKKGSAKTRSAQRSPMAGSNTNPASKVPRIQPTALTAYARPARLGFPCDRQSTSIGVMNPTAAQNGPMPKRISKPPWTCALTRGSVASKGKTAQPPARMATNPLAKRFPLSPLLSIQSLYPREPSAVAPKYTISMAANEYTTGPTIGMNWRVQTTSIPRLAKPEVNRSGRAITPARTGSLTTAGAGPTGGGKEGGDRGRGGPPPAHAPTK